MFTIEQWHALTLEQKSAVQAVAEALNGDDTDVVLLIQDDNNPLTPNERLEELFDLLGPCDGCVPDGYTDDLMENLVKKMRALPAAGRNLAYEHLFNACKLPKGWQVDDYFHFEIIVEPSYDDSSRTITIYEDLVLHDDSRKAWGLHLDNFEAMAAEVIEIRDAIIACFDENFPEGLKEVK
jgi:hypothetical protein